MRSIARFSFSVSSLCLFTDMAQAEKIALTTFLEPNHIITRTLHQAWADDLRTATDGEIDFEVFVGGTLMPALSQMRGIADGVALAGFHASPYTPSELPVSNALLDLGFRMADEFVLSYAFTDFMMHETVGLDEWQRNGVVYGANAANPTYYYLCRQDLSTPQDMKGKRVRTAGAGWARFADALGMVPVNIASSEIYTGLERGALDCANADLTHLISGATIMDLTQSVVMLATSPAFTNAGLIYDKEWWQGLTSDQRRKVLDANARAMARVQVHYAADVEAARAAAEAAGVRFNEPDPELLAQREQWVVEGIGGLDEVARNSFGIEDPDALFALFNTYVDKWTALMNGIDRTDEDALAALLKVNLFDGIDVETYGMN